MALPGKTLAQMVNLVAGTQKKIIRKKWIGSQSDNNYEPATTLLDAAKGDASGIGWQKNMHMQANDGATYTFDFYSPVMIQKAPAQKQLSAQWAKYENAGLRFDLEEKRQNMDDPEQIVDIMQSERETNNEDIAKKFRNDLQGIGPASATDLNTMYGLLYYARRSQTSGAFVANTSGGFTGQEITWSDGSGNSTTVLGQDSSLVENERLRNFTITHDGTFGLTTAQKVHLMLRRMQFVSFKNRQGEVATGKNSLFMSQTFEDAYIDMVNEGPDDRDGDLFPFTTTTLAGVSIKTIPAWNSRTDQPIVALRGNGLQISYFPSSWFTEAKPHMLSHREMYIATNCTGQLLPRVAPRECVGICHGSF
jgi:hypothetical protein